MDPVFRESVPAARRTLSRRLTTLVLASVGLSVGAIATFALWQDVSSYARLRTQSLTATAFALAATVSAPAARSDRAAILNGLRAIGRLPDLVHVAVFDVSGTSIAEIGNAARLTSDVDVEADGSAVSVLDLLASRTISVAVTIVHGGETVGRLSIVADASDILARLVRILGVTFGVTLLSLALGIAVSTRLKRRITRPIDDLIAATRDIAENHDYGRQITSTADGELGVLVANFNAMVFEIRERDGRLARHRLELEHTVDERTRDLRAAKDAAEAASAAKSTFLATMSHEIRTPLNGMMVMAELLNAGDLAAAPKRYAQVVASSGRNLLAIINDILDLSKVEAGKLDVERIALDPAALVDDIVLLFAEKARSKALDFAVMTEGPLPERIIADPVRLGQVVSNLVNNALKFTEQGSVSIVLRLCHDAFEIAVSDTGIGIAADKLDVIFDAFSQADQSTTRRFGGTGLGLAIARRIMTALGGDITVASRSGEGSTFSIRLPLHGAVPVASRARLAGSAAAKALLLIDGSATRAALTQALTAVGFDCAPAAATSSDATALALAMIDHEQADPATVAELILRGARVFVLAPMGASVAQGIGIEAVLRRPLLLSGLSAFVEALVSGKPVADAVSADAQGAIATQAQFTGSVLVVDDSAVNREVAIEALGRFGVAVTALDSGAAAIEMLQSEHFDLVLMDASMPEMDGFEATRQIRAQETASGQAPTAIVALTAHVVGDAAQAWRAAGMQGVIYKPFTLADLESCLAKHLVRVGRINAELKIEQPGVAGQAALIEAIDPEQQRHWQRLIAQGKQDFIRRIFDLYSTHGQRTLSALLAAAAATDSAALAEAAHALKSMSASIGASGVAAVAGSIENDARAHAAIPPEAALHVLAEEFAGAIAGIANFRAGHGFDESDVIRNAVA